MTTREALAALVTLIENSSGVDYVAMRLWHSNKLADARAALAQPDRTEELQSKLAELRDWVRCANGFMWAHEHGCPGRKKGGSACTCGLDQFLGRPRPFIESFKERLAASEERAEKMREALQKIADVPHDYPGDAFWFMRVTARAALQGSAPAEPQEPTAEERK